MFSKIEKIWLRRRSDYIQEKLKKNNIPYEIRKSKSVGNIEIRVKIKDLKKFLKNKNLKQKENFKKELRLEEIPFEKFTYLIFWY